MSSSRAVLVLFFVLGSIGLGVPEAMAIRPLYSPFAVVAGSQYDAGYQDGSFSTALFNRPLGLTVSGDGTRLFVADSLNHRIRVIHLDQNNEVGTVAGQALAGKSDGPLTLAQFREPRGVLYLPEDRLVVNDFGNQSLRFVDLKAGQVTTYRGGPPRFDGPEGPDAKPPVPLEGIKDMAYLPQARSILFTQPEGGTLSELDLATGRMATVMKDDPKLPHPSALWVQGNKIYVADRDLPSVFSMDRKGEGMANLQPAGTPLDKVLSLCSSDQILYGLLKKDGYPPERFILDDRFKQCNDSNQPVAFNNGWGDFVPPEKYYGATIEAFSPWTGFVPDPSGKRRLFYSIPNLNIIVSLEDLYIRKNCNCSGLTGGEYPAQKPKNTFRIMLCGNCGVTDTDDYLLPTETHPVVSGRTSIFSWNYSIAPQIEHELNFQAALDDNPMNYEILNAGHHGDLIFWPNTEVPDKAKKFDVDLVVILAPILDLPAFFYYYRYNLTPDGIPQAPPDPEYVAKPALERIPEGLPRKFYDYCKAHQLVKIEGNKFYWDDAIYKDPQLHDMLLEFSGKPWVMLEKKLAGIKTSGGKPVKLLVLFGYTGPQSYRPPQAEIYREVAKKYHIPHLIMDAELNALHLSYYPMTGPGHLDPNGAVFFGKLLSRILPKKGLIPWPTPERTPSP